MPAVETTSLDTAAGRVLARDVLADRPYPALDRTARDGFAVRSSDMPGRVRVIGEVRAGERFDRAVGAGEAVEIMTGAPVPQGADAIVMVEHVEREGDFIAFGGAVASGQFINFQGGESPAGALLLRVPNTQSPRYFFAASAFLLLLAAESFAALWRFGDWRRAVALAALSASLTGDALAFSRLEVGKMAPWTDALAMIAASKFRYTSG